MQVLYLVGVGLFLIIDLLTFTYSQGMFYHNSSLIPKSNSTYHKLLKIHPPPLSKHSPFFNPQTLCIGTLSLCNTCGKCLLELVTFLVNFWFSSIAECVRKHVHTKYDQGFLPHNTYLPYMWSSPVTTDNANFPIYYKHKCHWFPIIHIQKAMVWLSTSRVSSWGTMEAYAQD